MKIPKKVLLGVVRRRLVRGLGVLLVIAANHPLVAAEALTVNVKRRDLRPLPAVQLKTAGAANRQEVTDDKGQAAFPGLPTAGAITITPSRSGFRFEPTQLTVPNLANPPAAAAFTAFPTETDLELSMTSDDPSPLVGGVINGVITLRNLGQEAATDVAVAFGSLPGLVMEDRRTAQGKLVYRAYDTSWTLPRLDPGASAECTFRSRANLPDAKVLLIAQLEEMDQTDTNPLNNSSLISTRPRPAQARLSLAMTINPAAANAGEMVPARVTLRNEGPNEATQITIRAYLPPGVSFVPSADKYGLLSYVVIPRLAVGEKLELGGAIRGRWPGDFTLISNVVAFEQQLPVGAAWPEARADFTFLPASSRITLSAFTDPPNPRVGDDVNVTYVAKNEGPDAVTGLDFFTRADYRLGVSRTVDLNSPPPPVPGPFAFGDVLPAGAYTYSRSRYSVKAAGDLSNYFAIGYQDQTIPNGADYPEIYVPIKALPSDIGLSLDANPKDVTVRVGDPLTLEFQVYNEGPDPARGVLVNYAPKWLLTTESDEVIHADRVERSAVGGYIDEVRPRETVRVRKHFIASLPGDSTDAVELRSSVERPDLLQPIATEMIRLRVLPRPGLPDLAISVNVDKPRVNVGEYAIFVATITNRAAQPAINVDVSETDSAETDSAFETVRSFGPSGDDRAGWSAAQRTIPRLEPGASYSMSRTMRIRKPVTIPYVAKITGVNGTAEAALPTWRATTEVTGVQVTCDIAPAVVPDRTNVKNGDLVNFALIAGNLSTRTASHLSLVSGVSAGFQVLGGDLNNYGYAFDYARPRDLESGAQVLPDWFEIRPKEAIFSWTSAYAINVGQLSAKFQVAKLDQQDGEAANDLALAQITSAPASARLSLRQSVFPKNNASVGDFVLFVTEIQNEGPDRVTGLRLVETSSGNLELTSSSALIGVSDYWVTSLLDEIVRLPPLEPGQSSFWQRGYIARGAGKAWRRVRVTGVDQTPLAPLPENETALDVQSAKADISLEFLQAPAAAQEGSPTAVTVRVRNLGPSIATGVKVSLTTPDGMTVGPLGYGPRADYDFITPSTFRTNLRPGESATAAFYLTPTRGGAVTGFVSLSGLDQVDPNPANHGLSLTLNAGPPRSIPPLLRVRKVRTDFFHQTPVAEVEVDVAALHRLAPFTLFSLEGSSNLRDWEFLTYISSLTNEPVTFTDHANPGARTRMYRLRR